MKLAAESLSFSRFVPPAAQDSGLIEQASDLAMLRAWYGFMTARTIRGIPCQDVQPAPRARPWR